MMDWNYEEKQFNFKGKVKKEGRARQEYEQENQDGGHNVYVHIMCGETNLTEVKWNMFAEARHQRALNNMENF